MGFTAYHTESEEIVTPADVTYMDSVKGRLECTGCEETHEVRLRRPEGQQDHFFHKNRHRKGHHQNESYAHQNLREKTIATLKEKLPDDFIIVAEEPLPDEVLKENEVQSYRPDGLAQTPIHHPVFGIGVAVECEVHGSKNREAVTEFYNSCGFTVVWVELEDLHGEEVLLRDVRPPMANT